MYLVPREARRWLDSEVGVQAVTEELFDGTVVVPKYCNREFVPIEWESFRNTQPLPRVLTDQVASERDATEFLKGAELLRLHGDRKIPDAELTPQMLKVCDLLAAGKKRNAVLMPRRSGKTTSLLCVALGRAALRPGYRVAIFTMTTGKAGRSRFKRDVAPHLEYLQEGVDKKDWPYKVIHQAGFEGVEFKDSGGMVVWASSVADFRGEAFDLVILDEAGEPEAQKVQDTLAAAMPTTSTRKGSQLVVAGTAGKFRAGNLLWDWLESELPAKLRYDVLEEHTDEELEDWEYVRPLVTAMHPGVGNLTSEDDIHEQFDTLGPTLFSREYLGIFEQLGGGKFVNPLRWEMCKAAGDPEAPEDFQIGVSVDHEGRSAAIAYFWRDEDGMGHGVIDDHRPGTRWLFGELTRIAKKYPGKAIHYDGGSNTSEEIETFKRRAVKKPLTKKLGWVEISDGASRLKKDIDDGKFRHYDQPPLNNTASYVTKRGTKDSKRWSWGRSKVEGEWDITTFEAVSVALKAYDGKPKYAGLPPMSLGDFDT